MTTSRDQFIRALQIIHAGEVAAALAYRGHALAASDPETTRGIARIEQEEWDHRSALLEMLQHLGAGPDRRRERHKRWLGTALSFLCAWVGEWLPARIAGLLERKGAREYRAAAQHAAAAGEHAMVDPLMRLADVEDAHGAYFEALTRMRVPISPRPGEPPASAPEARRRRRSWARGSRSRWGSQSQRP